MKFLLPLDDYLKHPPKVFELHLIDLQIHLQLNHIVNFYLELLQYFEFFGFLWLHLEHFIFLVFLSFFNSSIFVESRKIKTITDDKIEISIGHKTINIHDKTLQILVTGIIQASQEVVRA